MIGGLPAVCNKMDACRWNKTCFSSVLYAGIPAGTPLKTKMNKHRILIVDDNAMIAKMMGVWLEKTGVYETLQESKPLLGVSAARRFKPDLVLLDVDMPEMDGPKVAAA